MPSASPLVLQAKTTSPRRGKSTTLLLVAFFSDGGRLHLLLVVGLVSMLAHIFEVVC